MWRNPNYPAPEAPAPPEERGRRLATLPRGKAEELRVTLDSFEGKPYLGLRVWSQGADGSWWPLKGKGLSIRVRELADVAAALHQADEILNGEGSVTGSRDRRRDG